MDTVSMLEEAINYVKFLKTQIILHQTMLTVCTGSGSESNSQAAAGTVDLFSGLELNGTSNDGFGYSSQETINPSPELLNYYSMAVQSEHSLPPLPCFIQEEEEEMLRP